MVRIAMVGAGYVGLVSGACFADLGHDVVCADNDLDKIERLKKGVMPIYEPGLAELVAHNVRDGRLRFASRLDEAVKGCDAIFIAVGTPSRPEDGRADLRHVFAAAEDIAAVLDGYCVVVAKSTVPVGAGDQIDRVIREKRPDADFSVVSNPEFLREGAAISDFKRPDRIVIGTSDDRARDVMRDVYRPLTLNESPILFTNRRTSELIKYASNAFLSTKITFINEIADLCEAAGADVQQVASGVGLDTRIGAKFLQAGPGYGGSCFPKDTMALVRIGQDHNVPLRIVETVVDVNERRKKSMALKVARALGGEIAGKRIAILGLTFKPNTDDMRDAPSLDLIPGLQGLGADVVAYDPEGVEQAKRLFSGVAYAASAYACAEGADALVIVTEWEQFRALDLRLLRQALRQPVIVDLRNIYQPAEMIKAGFNYTSIGRPLPA